MIFRNTLEALRDACIERGDLETLAPQMNLTRDNSFGRKNKVNSSYRGMDMEIPISKIHKKDLSFLEDRFILSFSLLHPHTGSVLKVRDQFCYVNGSPCTCFTHYRMFGGNFTPHTCISMSNRSITLLTFRHGEMLPKFQCIL